MKNSLFILLLFSIGLAWGVSGYTPERLCQSDLSLYTLYALMFLVGIGIGADKKSIEVIKETNIKIVLVPLSVIIGSLAGAGLVALFLSNISFKEGMAIGAGFGYYSLSSIFISEISGEKLGVIALLANIFREILTLVGTPLFVRYFGKLAGIAAGGATSMDSTLPIIAEYSGKEWTIISIFSGMVLTIIVPFLISFILEVL